MKLSKEQREGIHKMLNWVEGFDRIYLRRDRVREREVIKDQLLKVLLLDEYDKVDRELLNDLRNAYLKNMDGINRLHQWLVTQPPLYNG